MPERRNPTGCTSEANRFGTTHTVAPGDAFVVDLHKNLKRSSSHGSVQSRRSCGASAGQVNLSFD